MKDTRTYITLHDGMTDHPKIVGLSDAAFRLYIEALCYCSRHLTDGKILSRAMNKMSPAEEVTIELVEAGLLHLQGSTFEIHDYLKHQRSADEVAQMRAKRAESGRMGGLAKQANKLASASTVAKQTAKQTASTVLSKNVAVSVSVSETDKNLSTAGYADEVIKICEHLAQRMVENGCARPTFTKTGWWEPARLLLDRDKRTVEQVTKAIDFAARDDFWAANVLSVAALRKHYEKLRMKAQAKPASSPRAASSGVDAWLDYA